MDLVQKKEALLKKLESLKSDDLLNKSSETEFNFLGKCGEKHALETKLDLSIHGILSGQFVQITCENGCCRTLLVCVGVGDGCKGKEGKFLWFLDGDDHGVHYNGVKTLKEFKERYGVEII